MTAAVFVDRDGVINEPVWDTRTQSFESPYRPEDVALVPGAAEGLARLAPASSSSWSPTSRRRRRARRRSRRWPPCMNGWPSCCVRRAWNSTASYYCHHHPGLHRPVRVPQAGARAAARRRRRAGPGPRARAGWSATPTPTSPPPTPPGRARCSSSTRGPPTAAAARSRPSTPPPDLARPPQLIGIRSRAVTTQAVRRRSGPRAHPAPRRRRADPRLHDEPDPDVEGGADGLHRVLPAAAGGDHGPADLLRGVRRRRGRDPPPGADHRGLGRERLRQGAGDHDPRRIARRRRARPQRGRRPGQRDRALHARAGARDHRGGGRPAPRATCRSSPGGSPTPAATRSRSCARRWRSCARRRARS